jgi:hypothetical protein
MRKDDILLNEAYKKVHSQEPVDEAFNVTRARLAGVGGAIGGLKNRVVGGLQSGVGKMAAKAAGIDPSQAPTYQRGQDKVQAGKGAGKNAKIDSILKNQTQDINKFASKLTNQLVKLGLGNTATVGDIAGGMADKLKEILNKERPVTNQSNVGSPTPVPAPAPAATSEPTSEAPEEPKAEDQAATVAPTPAPVASNPSQPPVQQTNTAAQAADAMKETDTGSTPATPEAAPAAETPAAENQTPEATPTAPSEAAPAAEAPADSASANSAPAATEPTATAGDDSKITDQGGSPENETTPEEVQAAIAPTNAPQPKVNKSTYQSKNANRDVYKYVRTQQGKVWKNQRTKIVPTAAVQSNITNSWIRQQNAAQAEPQNESFRSFFWNS